MANKIKITKAQQKKLSKSWLGILLIIAIAGYNFYQQYKPIEKGERFEVTLDKCVDGDTAWFNVNGESKKARFLLIDTPESTKEIEPYGKEASNYTKNELENANVIELEYNLDGDQEDKYGRILVWVFVDGELLQEKLAKQGYVEKFYDYGYDYTYKSEIVEADENAKINKVGIYSE